jgi:nitrogen-specific signal transduction histidine kinase/CheY-like chemotaxis protein
MELSVGEALVPSGRIFTGFIRDLTSRHRMEAELRQAQKMEAVGQLTGGLAHDFNNLLTVITGNLEMLESRLTDERQRELLAEAQAAADDGAKLTGQLLAFGRRQPLNPKLTDIGIAVSGFTELLRRTLGESVELRTVVSGASNFSLVDSSQLQNALLNLALNARDAMPHGGSLTIEIDRKRIDPDYAQMYPEVRPGDYVLISVTDTGEGMSPEVRQRAFEPFFTTKPTGQGTGLGLSMVYGFVKQSGGHVQIYSDVGRGTSIRVFLPRAQAPRQAVDTTSAASATSLPRGRETILVVEDDLRVRRVTAARLRDTGYTVLEASTGIQALQQLEQHARIDLVFTDVIMPGGLTGDQLAQQIRTERPEIKVLLTSGYAEPMIAGREQAESGNWLRKPYTAADLAVRVRQLLDRKA